MARKTLLTEGEIRQFMKLANLGPIGSEKLQEMGYPMPGARDDEHSEDELHATEDELGHEDHVADEEADELGVDDMALDDEAEDDADVSGIADDEREELMADVVQAVADALGISDQVSIEAGAEGGEDLDEPALDDVDVDAAEFEMEPVDGGEEMVGAEEEEEIEEPMMEKKQGYDDKEDESLGMRTGKESDKKQSKKDRRDDSYGKFGKRGNKNESLSEDDIVAEVAKRVAARLQAENNREQVVDTLAERIMQRLTTLK
tara:strand:- start:7680 stop:8459 length:780 start_codon:yes stop_codon:yes gene_type:complete